VKLLIEMDMDNAAFEGNPGWEAARILRRRLVNIETINANDAGTVFPLMDANGNRVGQITVLSDDPAPAPACSTRRKGAL